MVELRTGHLSRAIVVVGGAVAAANRHHGTGAASGQHDAVTGLRPGSTPIGRIGITGQAARARHRRRCATCRTPARAARTSSTPCSARAATVSRGVHCRSAAAASTGAGTASAGTACPRARAAALTANRRRICCDCWSRTRAPEPAHSTPPPPTTANSTLRSSRRLRLQVRNPRAEPRDRSVPAPRDVTTMSWPLPGVVGIGRRECSWRA